MGRQFFGVENPEPRLREDARRRIKRKIGIMLIVDGVELQPLDEAQEVGKLENRHAFSGQELADPPHEIVDIGTWASTLSATTRSALRRLPTMSRAVASPGNISSV